MRHVVIVLVLFAVPSLVRADLVFYTGDGNFATEDQMIKYSSSTGISSYDMIDSNGTTYGWPTDFQRVGSQIYGIDAGYRQLMLFDDIDTGLWNPVGLPEQSDTGMIMSSLAYDPVDDRLYRAMENKTRIDLVNRTNNVRSTFLIDPQLTLIKAMAFDEVNRRLLAFTADTGKMLSIDPDTKAITELFTLDVSQGYFDEITYHNGELYGMWVNLQQTTGQLQHINATNGATSNLGPVLAGSLHALYIASVPEPSMFAFFGVLTVGIVGIRWFNRRRGLPRELGD